MVAVGTDGGGSARPARQPSADGDAPSSDSRKEKAEPKTRPITWRERFLRGQHLLSEGLAEKKLLEGHLHLFSGVAMQPRHIAMATHS